MIKLENVVLASPEQMEFIIEGMRNPMNSWEKSDSTIVKTDHEVDDYIDIGKTDYLLMQRLSKAGTDHRKFMRMMPVYVRITAPLYWWKEFDTLKDKEKHNWWQMIQLLPSSYNQTRNVMMNYEVLANIYQWRKDHKLDEWREFCKWIEGLPYSELITHPSSPITQAGDIVGRLASAMAAPLNCDGKVDNTRGTGLWQPGDED